MHPSYPRPTSITGQIKFVDILHLEKVENFKMVRQLMLTEKESFHTLMNANETVSFGPKLNIFTHCLFFRSNTLGKG